MRRIGLTLLAVLLLLVSGCSISSNRPKPPAAAAQIISLMQKQNAEALAALINPQGLRVAPYATDGGELLTGEPAKALLTALIKGAKPKLIATAGGGQTLHLAIQGLNLVDVPGSQQLKTTDLIQLSLSFETAERFSITALAVDPQGLLAGSIKNEDRWAKY